MLKNRLLFGTLMAMAFGVLVVLDGWLDGSLTGSDHDDKAVQATLLCVLVAVLMVPAHAELAGLAAAKNLKVFRPVTTAASIAYATTWYWPQLTDVSPKVYVYLISAFALMGLFLCQYFRCRTDTVLGNCRASCFSIIYLGVLSGFVVALRVDFGLWPMLMFICVIKSADIGAYACGSLFGKHKFSPQLSSGKTWQGMAGGAVTAVMVAILFALSCDIMVWWLAANNGGATA
ncbi:MAG: phosphatidate cytidylyltransferase [Planctomycetota bacterium]|jgi:phosphatidate cytidylyltransferase